MNVHIVSYFYFSAVYFILKVDSFDMPSIPSLPDMPQMPDMPVSPLSGTGISGEVREAIKTCRSQISLSPDEAFKIVTQDTPSSSHGECFLACVKKEIGIIGEDNTYNMDKIRETLAPLENTNSQLYEKAISAYEECLDAGADVEDYCEKAKKLRECVKTKRLGVN